MINCFLLSEKASHCGWGTLYLQIGLSHVTSFENLLQKHFYLTTVFSCKVKESFYTMDFFFSEVLNYEQN